MIISYTHTHTHTYTHTHTHTHARIYAVSLRKLKHSYMRTFWSHKINSNVTTSRYNVLCKKDVLNVDSND